MKFLTEVKARGVLKFATVYLGASWLVIVVGRTLFDVFELPRLPLQLVTILLLLGFPLALAAAWYYRPAARGSALSEPAIYGIGTNVATIAAVCIALAAVAVAIGFRASDIPGDWHHMLSDEPQEATGAAGERTAPTSANARATDGATQFAPPAHSVAVLPFVNMSSDPSNDYFSDGLSEELLDALSRAQGLQVAARTSSFSFKGKAADIPSIARKLNVAAVLEGSVRREGKRVRITAQLINAVTDYHFWSRTYDRDFKDPLALQTEIAKAVSQALEVTLMSEDGQRFELGGTRDPQAYDAYLRALKLNNATDEASRKAALAALDEALHADPNYAFAYALRARLLLYLAAGSTPNPALAQEKFNQARAAAVKAISLAPELGEAHATLASVLESGFIDFAGASTEYNRALALAPGSALVQARYAHMASMLGHNETAIAAIRRAIELDSLNPSFYDSSGRILYLAHRYEDSLAAYQSALVLRDGKPGPEGAVAGLSYLALGKPEAARASCTSQTSNWMNHTCLAIAYHLLARDTDAESEMAKLREQSGDGAAYQYAQINAQWGRKTEALKWLATAHRLRDPGVINIRVDPLLDPIRDAPEFKEVERQLKFPL